MEKLGHGSVMGPRLDFTWFEPLGDFQDAGRLKLALMGVKISVKDIK